MRIALFSDIHGNTLALDAVLQDIQQQGGVDAYWILGDLVAIGPDPIGVLERLDSLKNTSFTRGNTDRYIVTGERPPPTVQDVKNDFNAISVFKSVNESFAWTQGAITVANYLEFLTQLPLHFETTLEDGTNFLGIHASFGTDDGVGVKPETSDADLQKLFVGCTADLICVGHTHSACDRYIENKRIVNLGSISNPATQDLRASYVLLESSKSGYTLEHHKIAYDYKAFLDLCKQIKHPATEFIASHFLK